MLAALINKELRLLLSDLHGLAVLFIMPAVFLLIMSLAIPDESEVKQYQFSLFVLDKLDNQNSELLSALLEDAELIEKVTQVKSPPEILAIDEALLTVIPEFQLFANNKPNKTHHLLVQVSPKLDGRLQQQLKTQLAIAASQTRLKNVLVSLELLAPDLPMQAQVQELKSASSLPLIYEQKNTAGKKPSAVEQSMPAWLIFGMFFVVLPLSNTLIKERRSNTLARIKSFNLSASYILLHKLIPYALINQLQFVFLCLTALYLVPLLGGESIALNSPILLYLLMSLALSVAALGLGVLIAILCRTPEQAIVFGGGLNLVLAALGGIMIPAHIMSEDIQWLAGLSPMNWALDGFQQLLLFNAELSDITPNLLGLTGFGLITLLISYLIFQKQYRALGWN